MRSQIFHVLALTTIIVVVFGSFSTSYADQPAESSARSSTTNQPAQPTADDVRNWVVERMVAWSKPGLTLHPPAMESFEDGKARYYQIADAALSTVSKNKPIFGGSKGRVRTVALMLAISMFESAYRKDVDMNLGKLGRGDGGRSWCLMQVQLGSPIFVDEAGRRKTLVRTCSDVLNDEGVKISTKCEYVPPPGSKPSTPTRVLLVGDSYELVSDQTRGFSGQDLVADRELCFTVGLRIIRRSFTACKSLPMLERLSAYASGNCENGREASRRRMGAAVRWLAAYPSPVDDSQLVQLFSNRTRGPQTPAPVFMDTDFRTSMSEPLRSPIGHGMIFLSNQ